MGISCQLSRNGEDRSQWQREHGLRSSGLGYASQPYWFFSQDNIRHLDTWLFCATRGSSEPLRFAFIDPLRAGHLVICELVNAFSPVVYPWGKTPVEAPAPDVAGGVRPVLYYILRREYLHASGVGVCRNPECREFFEIERAGSEFCSEMCSRLQRQREYWQKRGKKLRKSRLNSKKPQSVARIG
jgi:hypothetical protein